MQGFGKSDVGKVRTNNEDAIFVDNGGPAPLANLYVLADGMGGHNAGEIASLRAVSAFCDYFEQHQDFVYKEQYLADALQYANGRVHNDARKYPEFSGMGTTLSAITTDSDNLYYAHVGDSRIYLVKEDGELTQITTDHISVTAELLAQGLITENEAKKYPETVLSRAIGTDVDVKIDVGSVTVEGIKYALLCSDGLHNMITDEEISAIINSEKDLETITEKLIAAANNAGGDDNISVIMIGWGD